MKRLIPAALLLVLFLSTEGPYLVFKILQQRTRSEIKQQIRNNIKTSELTLIRVPLSDLSSLHWVKENKEFRKEGELYDVVRTEVNEKFITYYCINDKKEESLIAGYKRFSGRQKTLLLLNRLIQNNYLPQVLDMPLFQRDIVYLFHFINQDYTLYKKDLNNPPPKYSALS